MLLQLASCHKVIGVKQSTKAVQEGRVSRIFFACDADPAVLAKLKKLCVEQGVEMTDAFTMQALGEASGISVGAAVAAVLREE